MTGQTTHTGKRQRLIAVLDVGTSKICCLIARVEAAVSRPVGGARGRTLRVIGLGYQRSRGIKAGTVVNMDAAEQAIRAAVDRAERAAGVTIDSVLLSVSCGRLRSDTFSASVAIAGDEVRGGDVDRLARAGRDYAAREGRAVLHCLATGYRIDDDTPIDDARGMIADQLSVDIHAVTADESALKNLILCVERCHLTVGGLACAPYASGLASVIRDEAQLGVMCLDMGAGMTTVSVFCDGHFVFSDAVALGGNQLTADLARALSTSLEEAERIKTLHGSVFATASDERELISVAAVGPGATQKPGKVTKAQLAQIIQPRVEESLQLVRERLEKAGIQDSGGQHVVLTGGASQLTGLADYASRIFARTVRAGWPFRLAGLPDRGAGPAFSNAVGLLMASQRASAELMPAGGTGYLATGTGYLNRVSQWIKESF